MMDRENRVVFTKCVRFTIPVQGLQARTCRAMSHTIWSRARLMSSQGWRRVLISAAQQKPVAVRTRMAVVPGRLPLCHQLPLPLFLTFQPLAYFTSAEEGFAGPGVVILAIES